MKYKTESRVASIFMLSMLLSGCSLELIINYALIAFVIVGAVGFLIGSLFK